MLDINISNNKGLFRLESVQGCDVGSIASELNISISKIITEYKRALLVHSNQEFNTIEFKDYNTAYNFRLKLLNLSTKQVHI